MAIVISRKFVIFSVLSILVLAGLIVGYWLFSSHDQRALRDLERLADMRQIQAEFEMIYVQENTYQSLADLGCIEGKRLADCRLYSYIPEIDMIQDPGEYSYFIKETPSKNGYVISFTLEGETQDFSLGEHFLTPVGIE